MNNRKRKRNKRYFKELIFTILWSIIFIKLFVVDIESKLFERYVPEYTYMLKYRFFFYALLVVIFWYILKSKRFFKNLLFFIGFPFYISFWKLPKIFLWEIPKYFIVNKRWLLIYSYINSIINLFWGVKFNVLKMILLIVSVILTFSIENPIILYSILLTEFFLLTILIYDKLKVAFQPLSLFKMHVELSKMKDKKKKKHFTESIISKLKDAEVVPDENEDAAKKLEKIENNKKKNIEQIILIKTFFSFISSRLKEFLSRRTYIVLFFIKTLLTFISAWFLLSMMNLIAFKISSSNFDLKIDPSFFDFIYYTFHSMLHGNIADIVSAGTIAKTIDIIAPFTSILITGTLLTVLFTVKTEQYRENLKEIIDFSDGQLEALEKVLVDNHKITMIDALKFLESKESYVYIIVKQINGIE